MGNKEIIKEVSCLARTVQNVAERLTILQKELGVSGQILPASKGRRNLKGSRKDRYRETLLKEKRA